MSQQFHTTDNLQPLLKKLLSTRPAASTLIILDLDNTVFQPLDKDHKVSHQWFHAYKNYLKTVKLYDEEQAQTTSHELSCALQETAVMAEIEPGMIAYCNELAQSYSIIGMTARPADVLFATHRQLNAIALDAHGAKTSALNFRLHDFPELELEFGPLPDNHFSNPRYKRIIDELRPADLVDRSILKRYARLSKGVLFSGRNPKGEALVALLKTINLAHFTSIIFADDVKEYLDSVAHELERFNAKYHESLEFVGIHYTALEEIAHHFVFDPKKHL